MNTNHLVVEADDAAANTTSSTVVWQVCRSYHTLHEDIRFVNYLQATTTADNVTAESLPYYYADADEDNNNETDSDAFMITVRSWPSSRVCSVRSWSRVHHCIIVIDAAEKGIHH